MKFSVLLPTRNGGKFLKDCISSILEESYEDFELIVSDNANTDETHEIIWCPVGVQFLASARQYQSVPNKSDQNDARSGSYSQSGRYSA